MHIKIFFFPTSTNRTDLKTDRDHPSRHITNKRINTPIKAFSTTTKPIESVKTPIIILLLGFHIFHNHKANPQFRIPIGFLYYQKPILKIYLNKRHAIITFFHRESGPNSTTPTLKHYLSKKNQHRNETPENRYLIMKIQLLKKSTLFIKTGVQKTC